MSSDVTIPNRGPGRRQRTTKPERIDIGTDELIRNDVLAAKYGVSERTLNRGGGPYVLIGGVKYRPHRQSNEHIAASVRRRNQPAATRPRRGARRRAV
jgi:hypothetical protein